MLVMEILASRIGYLRNSKKRSIMGGDLNFPKADWNGNSETTSGTQAFLNRLVWDNGYTQVVGTPTQEDALLYVYLVRPENSLISCDIVQGVSDHCGVLLEAEWEATCLVPQVEKLVPVYHKTDVLDL
jgi:hypothetical protein